MLPLLRTYTSSAFLVGKGVVTKNFMSCAVAQHDVICSQTVSQDARFAWSIRRLPGPKACCQARCVTKECFQPLAAAMRATAEAVFSTAGPSAGGPSNWG